MKKLVFSLVVCGLTACSSKTTTQAPTPIIHPTQPKLALVLGGGGAKGFAHIGVLKVLEKQGIKPELIVGTSSGSLVGSLYASGMPVHEIEEIATHVSNDELLDFTLSKQGFIEGVKLQQWVNGYVNQRPIEQLPIRFASVATDLNTKQKMVFTTGDTGLAVRASSSVVGVFIPPRINNRRYGDGGLSSLVPVQTAKELGAKMVIAVDISAPAKDANPKDFWALLDKTFQIMPKRHQSTEIALANIVIRPEVGDIGTTNMVAREATIKAGEIATEAKLLEIQQKLVKIQ